MNIPRAMKDPNLSWKAKGIYFHLWMLKEEKGRLIGTMEELLGNGATDKIWRVKSGIKELSEKGYLTRKLYHLEGRISSMEYLIH